MRKTNPPFTFPPHPDPFFCIAIEYSRHQVKMEIFSRIDYPETFTEETAGYYGLPDTLQFSAERLPEDTDIFLPPTVVPVSASLNDAERKKLISQARLLVRENRTRAKLLEACRIWHVVLKEQPDEHLYEFIAAADELFQSLPSTAVTENGENLRGIRYIGLLSFLDRAAAKAPEISMYCRCAVSYRIAGIYSEDRRSETLSLYTRLFGEFGRFTRAHGPQYLPDYLTLVKRIGREFDRYEKFKNIWPSMQEMERWFHSLVEKAPLTYVAQYRELLALYCGIYENMRENENTIFFRDGTNSREHSAAHELRFSLGEWGDMEYAIRHYRVFDDNTYLIFLGANLKLHFEGSFVQSISIPRMVGITLLGCIGYHRLDPATLALLRGWQKSADTLWAAAERMVRSSEFSETEFVEILNLYLHFLDRMNDIIQLSGNYEESEKSLKKLIVVTRYLWKIEKFHIPLAAAPYYPTWKKYPQFLKSLKKMSIRHANYAGAASCDQELFSISHPYESAFGEEYRVPSMISILNEKAKSMETPVEKISWYYFRKFEVKPGRYLICCISRGHGSESWSFFPDHFLHPQRVDCKDIDISPVVSALDNYRQFLEEGS